APGAEELDEALSPRRPDNRPLDPEHVAEDPIEQFAAWFREAEADVALEQAMTLATVDADGSPNARMVLLKGFGPDGFRFFTNLGSAKAGQLEGTPTRAPILFSR